MEQRSFQCLQDDLCTGLLVALKVCSKLCYLLGSVDVCRSAACDDTLFYCCSCCIQSIFHTKLCFLHLSLGCSADTDHCHTACELCKTLLQLLFIKLGLCLLDLSLDLSNAVCDCFLIAHTVNDNGALLLYLNRLCMTKHIHGRILQLDADLLGNNLSAGQNRDISEHLFSSVAIARSLYTYYREGSTQLVHDQGSQCLALDVLSDDEKLSACLYDLLQQRKDLLNVADLLICDQDARIIQNCFHLLSIGCHICGNVSSVELHSFYQIQLGLHGLGLLDGDNAVAGYLLHCICNELSYGLISG